MNKKLLGLILSALTAFSLTSAVGCAEVEENFQSFLCMIIYQLYLKKILVHQLHLVWEVNQVQ